MKNPTEHPYDPFIESRLHDAEHKLAMSRKEANVYCVESAGLRHIERNKWSVSFNTRIGKWTVQEQNQVCGNIGEDSDISIAIAKAVVQHAKDTPTGQDNDS